MKTVYVVEVTLCDGYDHSSWVESIWSTEEKAEQSIIGYKELDEENREYNHKDKKGDSKESVARVEWVNEWTD